MTYLACMLIALALHRLWNMEEIFAPLRALVSGFKPLACSSCNAFWVSVPVAYVAYVLGRMDLVSALFFPFTTYPLLRLAAWAYAQPWSTLFPHASGDEAPWMSVGQMPPASAAPAQSTPAPAPVVAIRPADPSSGCASCDEKKKAVMAERTRTDGYKQRVVQIIADNRMLLTAVDDASVLAGDTSRLVQMWIPPSLTAMLAPLAAKLPQNVELRPLLPEQQADNLSDRLDTTLTNGLIWLGNASVITYGLIDESSGLWEVILRKVGAIRAFAWVHRPFSDTATFVAPPYHRVLLRVPSHAFDLTSPESALSAAQPIPA